MSLVNKTNNEMGRLFEQVTLPVSGTAYSSEINAIKVKPTKTSQVISFLFTASAVAGTDVNVSLYGAMKKGGTKFLLKADIVTALTNAVKSQGGTIDVKTYPAPFYYLGFTVDADNSANNVQLNVSGDLNGSQE